MSINTGIAWTNHTWNPWTGCTKVSAGCTHCYMYREKRRFGQDPNMVTRSSAATFRLPLSRKIKAGDKVFTCSWSDWFHEAADPWRNEAWDIIRQRPDLVFQILTKRPERMAACLPSDWGDGWQNVWLGVTAENEAWGFRRIPVLVSTPAAKRFISCEPLLGSVTSRWMGALGRIHWVIVGGESGPNARPMHPDWVRELRDECGKGGIPFFFKQWGEWAPFVDNGPLPPNCVYVGRDGEIRDGYWQEGDECMGRVGTKRAGRVLDGREWLEFPA